MAVKEGKINIFKYYHTEIPSFPRKTVKSIHKEKVTANSIKPSNASLQSNIGEQVLSSNIKSSKEKLINPLRSEPDLTDKASVPEVRPAIPQPRVISLPKLETTLSSEVQTSQTVQSKDREKYYCPYLDYLTTFDPFTGERYSDPEAKMKEIIEEMKLWEGEDFPNLDRQNNPKSSKCDTSVRDKNASGNSTKDASGNSTKEISKWKVECPHCKKNVVAVRFVPHLSKCMGVNSRRSSRQTRKK